MAVAPTPADALPVLDVLPALLAALGANQPVALVAPPGAGKTTAVPPALLAADWAAGQRIIVTSPRRLAARAAAERMAAQMGQPLGQLIGFRTRLESAVTAATRIEVVTEGIFTRQLIANPDLPGVAAVLFDEVHERSLESDLGLALLLEARAALRPDLRLLLMSATMDGAQYQRLIPDLALVESLGRMFPVTLRHVGRNPAERLEAAMASAIRGALADEPGSVLAFLPGAAEIERTATLLEGRLPADIALHRLYGARDGADQRAAIAPAAPGTRKIVLATSIAETSITINGVRVVVDSGLARRPRLDRAVGLARLVTERASQAAVTQRAGRAGRTAPGVAIRLWEAAETAGRPPYDPPAILDSDLAGLLLDCAAWGVADVASLPWRDAPPPASVADARARLLALGAIDGDGRITPHGRALARLPLAPAEAHMLLAAAPLGLAGLAAELAVLLSERGLGGNAADVDERLRNWRRDRSPRSVSARKLAARMVQMLPKSALPDAAGPVPDVAGDAPARCLALAFPDRVARRRGGAFLMANGRAVQVPDDSHLARADWIVVGDASGAASGARVLLAAALDAGSVEELLQDQIVVSDVLAFDPATTGVVAERQRRLGAITLARQPVQKLDAEALVAALLAGVEKHGLALLPWGEAAQSLRDRASFALAHGLEIADLSDDALLAGLADWLGPALTGKRRLTALDDADLAEALRSHIGWAGTQALDRFAPARLSTPAGSSHAIDYAADGGPAVEVRVQALFGLTRHPMLADGRVPLTLRLTSPAGRPIQVTRDLPGFWAGSWADVKKDLKGRYPKHSWPDDPLAAPPTLRARRPGQP